MDVEAEAATPTQYRQRTLETRQHHPNKYVFLLYLRPKLPNANPRKAVYLNVKFTECEIVKLNQMKSWLVSGGGIGHV